MDINESLNNLVDKMAGWLDAAIVLLPNLAAALLIFVVAVVLGRVMRRGIRRLLGRVSANEQVSQLVSSLAYITILGIGLFVALGVLGLSKTVTALLAGVGILGLALGFAFQDIAENFISGVLIAFRRPLRAGDIVETNDFMGTVESVNLRTTILKTADGKHVLVPNSQVLQNPIVNYSRSPTLRLDLTCGVAYGDDLDRAEKLAITAVSDLPGRDMSRDVELSYEAFGESSIDFVLRIWIEYQTHADYARARSDAIKRLKKAFDDGGITIPFPIRTLDFGVVGGEKLNEVLPQSFYGKDGGTG